MIDYTSCYFCNHKIEEVPHNKGTFWTIHWDCPACHEKYPELEISNTLPLIPNSNKMKRRQLKYAHIFANGTIKPYMTYHVRLHILENRTEVEARPYEAPDYTYHVEDIQTLAVLPGFPINPQNAIEKINLIRIFL